MKVVSAEQMRAIDRAAVARGISTTELMERAGRAIADGLAGLVEPGPVLVLCGRGNNGGDGFVAARYLAQVGYEVYVIPVAGTEKLSTDARQALERLPEQVRVRELPAPGQLREMLREMDGVIDAMLGTGSAAPL